MKVAENFAMKRSKMAYFDQFRSNMAQSGHFEAIFWNISLSAAEFPGFFQLSTVFVRVLAEILEISTILRFLMIS